MWINELFNVWKFGAAAAVWKQLIVKSFNIIYFKDLIKKEVPTVASTPPPPPPPPPPIPLLLGLDKKRRYWKTVHGGKGSHRYSYITKKKHILDLKISGGIRGSEVFGRTTVPTKGSSPGAFICWSTCRTSSLLCSCWLKQSVAAPSLAGLADLSQVKLLFQNTFWSFILGHLLGLITDTDRLITYRLPAWHFTRCIYLEMCLCLAPIR